jgi:hypothetical protein
MSNETENNESVGDVIEAEVVVGTQETETTQEESQGEAVTEDDSASSDEEATDTEDLEAETTEKKDSGKKSNFNKRITQVIEQRDAERKERERLAKEIEELRNQQVAKVENVAAQFNKPKPEQFNYNTMGEFTEALSDWKFEQHEFVREQKVRQEQEQQVTQKSAETWNSREKVVKADIEDYDAVVNVDALGDVNLTRQSHLAARTFLTDSELGPNVLYELLQNDELAKEFASATPVKQVKILTKIESKLESKAAAKPTAKPTTLSNETIKVPPKLKGGIRVATKSFDEVANSNDFAEYARLRKSQK